MIIDRDFLNGRKSHLEKRLKAVYESFEREDIPEDHKVYKEIVMIPAIQKAITRINFGSYGFCSNCDCEISKQRLMVVPEAEYCVFCQNLKEQKNS